MTSGGSRWAHKRFSCLPFLLLPASGHLAPNFPPGVHANQNARMLFDAFAHVFWISPSTLATPVFPKHVLDMFFPLFAWRHALQSARILPWGVLASNAQKNELSPWRPTSGNRGMCKNTLLLLAKILKPPYHSPENVKIGQFRYILQNQRVFLCFFPPCCFSYFRFYPSIWITVWLQGRGLKKLSPVPFFAP